MQQITLREDDGNHWKTVLQIYKRL